MLVSPDHPVIRTEMMAARHVTGSREFDERKLVGHPGGSQHTELAGQLCGWVGVCGCGWGWTSNT
ncbi:hypothetical protein C0Q70_14619 [Pomacea canaliculata]|uniref:Uncharacterized protein n=1 Tax=Pomacea canaliculata TaxID=400727 RepID=A0A2T7NSI9_POMCA|nr:hypothetical protein C0Q70_14619 [Pomacea canaliculata]